MLTTVLFTDIVGSTQQAATLGDRRWRARLDDHDRIVRSEVRRFRGREINTTGDGFVAAFDGPARAIRCARSIVDGMRPFGIEIRAGMHTGEVVVSGTVKDLVVGSGIEFAERGEQELKGVPGTWKLFSVAAQAS